MQNKNAQLTFTPSQHANLLDTYNYSLPPQALQKTSLASEIKHILKIKLNFSIHTGEETILIKTEKSRFFENSREIVEFRNLNIFLKTLSLAFHNFAKEDDFINAYICLVKMQNIISFLFKQTRVTLVNHKEWLISHLNEVVFLQRHGLTDLVKQVYKKVFNFFKNNENPLKRSNISQMTDPQFFSFLAPAFEKKKLRLRSLLSFCLLHSEELEHNKAVKKGEKAFNEAVDLLVLTMLAAYFYIFKNINKLNRSDSFQKETKKLKKIEYLANFIKITKEVIKLVENIPCSKLKDSLYLKDMLYFENKLQQFQRNTSELDVKDFSMTFQNFNKHKNTNLKKIFGVLEKFKDKSDLSLLNNPTVLESTFLNETTILALSQLNYYSYCDVFVTENLKNEISENSLLEKIAFVIISLYVLATEHRFIEHKKHVDNKFYRFLFDYTYTSKRRNSELYLGRAVEVGFKYMADQFPFISQIFNVFKKFELNRGKCIPENDEEKEEGVYLRPVRNGFKTNLILPIVRFSIFKGKSIFDDQGTTLKLETGHKKFPNPKKRMSSYKKRTVSHKERRRRSATGKRSGSSETMKNSQNSRNKFFAKNNNYLQKVRNSLLKKNNEFDFKHNEINFKTADNFFQKKKKNPKELQKTISSSKKKREKENNSHLPNRKLSKSRQKKFDKGKTKVKFSPIVQKYLSSKLCGKENNQLGIVNSIQNNCNKLNISFNNVGNLNFVINSFANVEKKKTTPDNGNLFKISKNKIKREKGLKKVFKNKSTLDDILLRFRNR